MAELGKAILALGVILVVVGGALILATRFGLPLGRLPGDFAWRCRNLKVFFPLGTCILISVVLTLLFYLLARLRR
jgi:hypothetical protein